MRHTAPHCLLIAALLCAGLPAHADETPLGRLFFSTEKRQVLDRQRQAAEIRAVETGSSEVTLNGVVRRSTGKNTSWLNGSPTQGEPGGDIPDVRVGDSIDPLSGKQSDLLRGGTLSIQRDNRPARP